MLDIKRYITEKMEIQDIVLFFVDNPLDDNDTFEQLQKTYANHKIGEDKYELTSFLRLILKIANNHFRSQNFFEKIEKILMFVKNDMKKHFKSNEEIYKISQSNKRITLFLININILNINQNVANSIYLNKYRDPYYPHYFYPEIEKYLTEKEKINIKNNLIDENFEENRKIGENHKYICKLIREDSVEEFITQISKINLSLTYRFEPSIFETNRFLIKNSPNLIEYAAFYGSIEIFKYLFFSRNDLLKPSLWNYVIHGRNPELIHFLEENEVSTIDNRFYNILNESIKCHHNEIANYFLDNFIDDNQKDGSFFESILKSYNFAYFPNDLDNSFLFFHLCKNDYFKIVKSFLYSINSNADFKTISIYVF